jgi:hypothetical protein
MSVARNFFVQKGPSFLLFSSNLVPRGSLVLIRIISRRLAKPQQILTVQNFGPSVFLKDAGPDISFLPVYCKRDEDGVFGGISVVTAQDLGQHPALDTLRGAVLS